MTLEVSDEFRPTRAILDKARRAEAFSTEYNARAVQGFVWGEDRAGRQQEIAIALPWEGVRFEEAFDEALDVLAALGVRHARYRISYEVMYAAGAPLIQSAECEYGTLRLVLRDSLLMIVNMGNRVVCAGVMGHPVRALQATLG